MKKVLVIVMLIFAFGCSDDGTNPEPNEDSIVGKWKTFITFAEENSQTYPGIVILDFDNIGNYKISFEELPGEEIPEKFIYQDEGKYTISDDILTVVNNKCENIEGTYKIKFKDNGVEFMIIEDDCNRNHFISDFYYDFDAEIDK